MKRTKTKQKLINDSVLDELRHTATLKKMTIIGSGLKLVLYVTCRRLLLGICDRPTVNGPSRGNPHRHWQPPLWQPQISWYKQSEGFHADEQLLLVRHICRDCRILISALGIRTVLFIYFLFRAAYELPVRPINLKERSADEGGARWYRSVRPINSTVLYDVCVELFRDSSVVKCDHKSDRWYDSIGWK